MNSLTLRSQRCSGCSDALHLGLVPATTHELDGDVAQLVVAVRGLIQARFERVIATIAHDDRHMDVFRELSSDPADVGDEGEDDGRVQRSRLRVQPGCQGGPRTSPMSSRKLKPSVSPPHSLRVRLSIGVQNRRARASSLSGASDDQSWARYRFRRTPTPIAVVAGRRKVAIRLEVVARGLEDLRRRGRARRT